VTGAGETGDRRGSHAPVVLLPMAVDEDALDASLAALDAGATPGTRVWLADDAQAGPRARAVIDAWLKRTVLAAHYSRRERSIGAVAHLDDALTACAGLDVVVLAPGAVIAPGCIEQLADCLARDASIATATPWCNAGETAAWPRCGEVAPMPDDLERLARACGAMPPRHPELPSAVAHAVALRGSARTRAGGLDRASYRSWYAALVDLSLRLSGLGWRNVLCETTFVASPGECRPDDGDLDALAARWPGWHARLAEFLMHDPLRATRAELGQALARTPSAMPQRELFG
jgi:hypothetical protein